MTSETNSARAAMNSSISAIGSIRMPWRSKQHAADLFAQRRAARIDRADDVVPAAAEPLAKQIELGRLTDAVQAVKRKEHRHPRLGWRLIAIRSPPTVAAGVVQRLICPLGGQVSRRGPFRSHSA